MPHINALLNKPLPYTTLEMTRSYSPPRVETKLSGEGLRAVMWALCLLCLLGIVTCPTGADHMAAAVNAQYQRGKAETQRFAEAHHRRRVLAIDSTTDKTLGRPELHVTQGRGHDFGEAGLNKKYSQRQRVRGHVNKAGVPENAARLGRAVETVAALDMVGMLPELPRAPGSATENEGSQMHSAMEGHAGEWGAQTERQHSNMGEKSIGGGAVP